MLPITLLLWFSLAAAVPLVRYPSQGHEVVKSPAVSRGDPLSGDVFERSLADSEEFVDLFARGKRQKKKNKNKITIQVAGSGGAPIAYAREHSPTRASGSGQPRTPPHSPTHSPPHSPTHANHANQPHSPTHPPAHAPAHAPVHAPAHGHGHGAASGSNTATTQPPPPRAPLSFAATARLAHGAQQAGRRATTRAASPPPFTPTPQAHHAGIMRRVNDARDNARQQPYPSGTVAHAFHHRGVAHHLISGDRTGGLDHINTEHGPEFDAKGWTNRGHIIEKAIRTGRVVAHQNPESGDGRPIYEFQHNGGTHHLAVSTRPNGYIVGANVSDQAQVARYQEREREHRAQQEQQRRIGAATT